MRINIEANTYFLEKDSLNKGGVIFDPRNPNDGLIAFNQYFVAGYRDQDTDTLYLIDENKVLWKFDDNNASPRTTHGNQNALAWMRLIASQQQGYWQIVIPISLLISMQTIRFITHKQ